MFDLISSATVGLTSVFLLFNIATKYRCRVRTYDIKGAFLHAKFTPQDEVIYIKISKEVAAIWVTLDPTAAPFIDNKGELLLQLDKFIYGLKQAPYKWQQLLSSVLEKLGYRKLVHDECVMVRRKGQDFSILCLHVNDILCVSNTKYMYNELTTGLTARFGSITACDNATAYLGMQISCTGDRSSLTLTQEGLAKTIIARYPSQRLPKLRPTSPTSEDFLTIPETGTPEAALIDQNQFLSIIMQLMYLARLTRPDILLPVTYLATRSNKATVKDQVSVQRIIDYLAVTSHMGITINCTDLQVYLRADAAHGIHSDAKGHTGFILALGPTYSYIHARSGKQRLVAHSSTEAEIISATDCVKMGIWVRHILAELSIAPLQQMVLHQDNMSAIMLLSETSKAKRSKHILLKITYIKDLVIDGTIAVEHIPTDRLTPDILTKPKYGVSFQALRDDLMGSS
jgi:hypothetical protein